VVGVLYGVLDIGKFFTEPLYSAMMPASIILAALVLLARSLCTLQLCKGFGKC
jgi:Leu/Phe-tRNA-protein transferase